MKQKTYLFLAIAVLTILLITPAAVHAQAATPSSSLKDKIKELQQQIASKAAQLKQEVNQKLQNKAYIGFIKSKNSSSITLASSTGSKIVSLNTYTIYSGDKVSNINHIVVDDYVVALGDIDDTGVLTAKKIIKLPEPGGITKKIIAGEISSIEQNTITIRTTQNETISALLSPQTTILAKKNLLAINDLKIGFRIAMVTMNTQGKTNDVSSNTKVRFIYVIANASGGTNIMKEATSSAEATASAKAATSSAKSKK